MSKRMKKIIDFVTNRWFIKTIFFLIFLGAIVQLLMFERWAKGLGSYVPRPEAVAGLLPVGHFTSFFGWIRGAGWDTILPAGLVIIIGALAVSLIFKRGFCGYICPVGTFWEYFSLLGRKVFGHNFKLPKWIDYIGRGFQIFITSAAVFLLLSVSLAEVASFRKLPYMWVADLKIIHQFSQPTFIILALVCIGVSFFFSPLWCRYLCPVGGLYSIVGMASPCKVHRNDEACTHCGKCAKACHVLIDPSQTKAVNSNVCDGCMECVKACPERECLEAKAFNRIVIHPWVWTIGVVVIWLIIWLFFVAIGQWHTTITDEMYRQVINSGILESTTKGFF